MVKLSYSEEEKKEWGTEKVTRGWTKGRRGNRGREGRDTNRMESQSDFST